MTFVTMITCPINTAMVEVNTNDIPNQKRPIYRFPKNVLEIAKQIDPSPECVPVLLSENRIFNLIALPVWLAEGQPAGFYPVESVEGIPITTTDGLLDAITTLIAS